MCHFGGQCQRVLFSKVAFLGDLAFTRKPIDHQHGERGISPACDVRARGQYRPYAHDVISVGRPHL